MGLVAALIAVLFIAAGGGGTSITDPAGDSGTAPDITGLDLGVDDNGLATFRVDVPLLETDTTSIVSVYIDADNNPSTGSPGDSGADYLFEHFQSDNSFDLSAWSSTEHDWISVSDSSGISARHDPSGITFSINRSRLGNASQVSVFATSTKASSSDRTPNGGTTSFDLAPFTLNVVTFHAGTVKAGGRLTITMVAKQSDNGEYGNTVTCALTGASLHPLTAAILTSNGVPTGTCVWSISKKLKGKTLHASITESSEGRSVTKTATVKVR